MKPAEISGRDLEPRRRCQVCNHSLPLVAFSVHRPGKRRLLCRRCEANRAYDKDLKALMKARDPKTAMEALWRVARVARVARSVGAWHGHEGLRAYAELGSALAALGAFGDAQ